MKLMNNKRDKIQRRQVPARFYKIFFAGILVAVIICAGIFFHTRTPWPGFDKSMTPEIYTEQVLGAYHKRVDEYRAMQKKNISAQGDGVRYVIADRLCLRPTASMDQKPLGEITFQSNVVVQDASNPEWYKIANPSQGLEEREDKGKYSYYDADGKLIIESSISIKGASDIFVSSQYLSDEKPSLDTTPPENPQHPFKFGLEFYNPELASMLASEVWGKMSDTLIAQGYDGIVFVPTGSGSDKSTEDRISNQELDGMGTSTDCFTRMLRGGKDGQAFAMQTFKNDAETHSYTGYIIANKDANIKSLRDLKGKTIFTGRDGSMSSYKLQLNALKKAGIEKEDLHLVSGLYHYQIFTAVAEQIPMNFDDPKHITASEKGTKADAAFVGNFIMQSATFDEFNSNKKFGLKTYANEAELLADRKKVVILPIKIDNIPEQPLLLSKKLYDNTAFRDEFRRVLTEFFAEKSEKYGVAEATTDLYKNIPEY